MTFSVREDYDIVLHEKCQHCHLFIEENLQPGDEPGHPSIDGLAAYIHHERGDEADELITSNHDAEPSGEIATLEVWRRYGPLDMRLRFDYNDFTVADVDHMADTFGTHAPEPDEGAVNVGSVVIDTDGYTPAEARALASTLNALADFAQAQIQEF